MGSGASTPTHSTPSSTNEPPQTQHFFPSDKIPMNNDIPVTKPRELNIFNVLKISSYTNSSFYASMMDQKSSGQDLSDIKPVKQGSFNKAHPYPHIHSNGHSSSINNMVTPGMVTRTDTISTNIESVPGMERMSSTATLSLHSEQQYQYTPVKSASHSNLILSPSSISHTISPVSTPILVSQNSDRQLCQAIQKINRDNSVRYYPSAQGRSASQWILDNPCSVSSSSSPMSSPRDYISEKMNIAPFSSSQLSNTDQLSIQPDVDSTSQELDADSDQASSIKHIKDDHPFSCEYCRVSYPTEDEFIDHVMFSRLHHQSILALHASYDSACL